jgi:hypothetical protein
MKEIGNAPRGIIMVLAMMLVSKKERSPMRNFLLGVTMRSITRK